MGLLEDSILAEVEHLEPMKASDSKSQMTLFIIPGSAPHCGVTGTLVYYAPLDECTTLYFLDSRTIPNEISQILVQQRYYYVCIAPKYYEYLHTGGILMVEWEYSIMSIDLQELVLFGPRGHRPQAAASPVCLAPSHSKTLQYSVLQH